MTHLPDIINQNINKYAPAMDALAKGVEVTKIRTVWDAAGLKLWEVAEESAKGDEMNELKPCPFCGQEAEESFAGGGNIACSNNDCQAGMLMLYPNVWNTRPIEDKLLSQLAVRDALIERLVEAGSDMPDERWYSICREWQAMKAGEG